MDKSEYALGDRVRVYGPEDRQSYLEGRLVSPDRVPGYLRCDAKGYHPSVDPQYAVVFGLWVTDATNPSYEPLESITEGDIDQGVVELLVHDDEAGRIIAGLESSPQEWVDELRPQ